MNINNSTTRASNNNQIHTAQEKEISRDNTQSTFSPSSLWGQIKKAGNCLSSPATGIFLGGALTFVAAVTLIAAAPVGIAVGVSVGVVGIIGMGIFTYSAMAKGIQCYRSRSAARNSPPIQKPNAEKPAESIAKNVLDSTKF